MTATAEWVILRTNVRAFSRPDVFAQMLRGDGKTLMVVSQDRPWRLGGLTCCIQERRGGRQPRRAGLPSNVVRETGNVWREHV